MADTKDTIRSAALSSDSKERWARHAITKLSKGYVLIVSKTKNVANFHKSSGGYETCPHRTAMRLIKEGYLFEAGEHSLGIVYELKEEFKESNQTSKKQKKTKKAVVKEDTPPEELDSDLDTSDLDDEIDAELEAELGDEEGEDDEELLNEMDDD